MDYQSTRPERTFSTGEAIRPPCSWRHCDRRGTVIGTDLLPHLETWIVAQRWFAGKGRKPQLEVIGAMPLIPVTDESEATIYLVLDRAENPLLYQVPISERRVPLPGAESALVAEVTSPDGPRYLYDGPRDPDCALAILRLITHEGEVLAVEGGGRAIGHSSVDEPIEVSSSRVLGGEQSNTSIVYETARHDGRASSPIVCKIFRTIHDGENPDVALTTALGLAGSAVAPRPVGSLLARWADTGANEGVAEGHLAFAEEFLPGAEDGWREALEAAANGQEFSVRARELGRITADMHATLAATLPSRAATPADIAVVLASMNERFDSAASAVPSL
ncbi:MAG: phosphotransferase, partial [Microbacteriaceae bacterium]|nr:phosphotransferase [Microbacteriaceae bacterium]